MEKLEWLLKMLGNVTIMDVDESVIPWDDYAKEFRLCEEIGRNAQESKEKRKNKRRKLIKF